MSEQDLPPLPPDIDALLRQAPRPVPPPGFGTTVLERIKGTVGSPPPPPAPPVSKMGTWGAPVSVAALVVGASVGVFVGTRLAPPPPPAPAPVVVVQTPAPLPAPDPIPEPPPAVPPKPTVRPPPPAVRPARDFDLADERALVEMGRSALARRETEKAMAALEDHARRFPKGQLVEERESLWIQALVNAGQADAARKRAADFHARFPESMLWPTIEAAVK